MTCDATVIDYTSQMRDWKVPKIVVGPEIKKYQGLKIFGAVLY